MAAARDSRLRVRIFQALSVESRLRIMRLLARRALCVGALSDLLGISAGAVSQHLRVLKDAGLVESERRGLYIHYRVAAAAMERCMGAMASLFSSASERAQPVKYGKPESCPPALARKCHGGSEKRDFAKGAGGG